MSALQSNPAAILIPLLIWLLASVCFCVLVAYLGSRWKRRNLDQRPASTQHRA